MFPSTRVILNPEKEARNRRDHRLGFDGVAEILTQPVVEYLDTRPLGYDHEGRERVLVRLRGRVVVLVFEPVEIAPGEFAVKPISLRRAELKERRLYEEGA
jgi:uncharacterized DUF497 family protein